MQRVGPAVAFVLLALGCGQTTHDNGNPNSSDSSSDAGRVGSTATSGTGTLSASTSATSTSASSTSGSSIACDPFSLPDLPPLTGQEYRLLWDGRDSASHLRFSSESEAVHTFHFGTPETFQVERGACADLEQTDVPPDVVIDGPIVLVDAGGEVRIALSEALDGGVGEQALMVTRATCTYSPSSWTESASVELDDWPTLGSVKTQYPGFLLPWESFQLTASKPPASPLSETVTIQVDGADAALEEVAPDVFSLRDGFSLMGNTLDFRGYVDSTNGVSSPFPDSTLSVESLSATGAVLDLSNAHPPGTVLFGGGEDEGVIDDTCPTGCLRLSYPGQLAFALRGPGSKVALTYVGGASFGSSAGGLILYSPDQPPVSLGFYATSELTTVELPLEAELGDGQDVYGTILPGTYEVGLQPGLGPCSASLQPQSFLVERIELVE